MTKIITKTAIVLSIFLYIFLTFSFINFVSGGEGDSILSGELEPILTPSKIIELTTSGLTTSTNLLKTSGYTGMEIVSYNVDSTIITDESYVGKAGSNFNFISELKREQGGISQNIFLANDLLIGVQKNVSILIKINCTELKLNKTNNNLTIKSLEIRWNGKKYDLSEYPIDNPLNLSKVNITEYDQDGKPINVSITPSILFDSQFNKKIDYKDVTAKGGYASVYSNNGECFVNLKIDNFSLPAKSLVEGVKYLPVDPVYYNQSDGFSISSAGDGTYAGGIYFNNSNFWVVSYLASTAGVVYSFDKNGANSTYSFFTNNTASTNKNPVGLWGNGSIFFITNNVVDNIYRYNQTGGTYLSSVSTTAFGIDRAYGITGNLSAYNGTNLWVVDDTDNFVYQLRRDNSSVWYNQTGFDPTPSGAGDAKYITTNNSDFWIIDSTDNFVYHLDKFWNNMSDGFSLTQFGINSPGGITTNVTSGSPRDFWVTDSVDLFVYHIYIDYELQIVYPLNNSYHKVNNINVNYTAQSTILNCWYSNDSYSKNTSLATCGTNITGLNWSEGFHEVTIWGNNSYGAIPVKISFTIDTINPIVSLITPLNNTLSNIISQVFSGSIIDSVIKGMVLHIWDYLGNEVTTNETCFQEFTNKSTSCGGLNTGTYTNLSGSNLEQGGRVISNYYDGDWGTFVSQDAGGNGSLFINYTKPLNAKVTSSWNIMYGSTATPINASLSIPSDCWNYSSQTISFRVISWNFGSAGNISTYCYNGTWNMLTNNSNDNVFYEEAMFWDLSGIPANLTGTSNQTSWNYTLSDGNYTWNIEGFDYLSHSAWNTVGNYALRIDSTNPSINLTSPYSINYATNTSLNLNFTFVEPNLDSCYYNIINKSGGAIIVSNTSLPLCQNITFNLSNYDGNYNITVYVNDTFGNVNSSRVTFGVRVNSPSINLDSPSDNQFFNHSESIYFNFTAFRDIGIDTCELYGNFSGAFALNYTWINPTNNTMNFTIQNLTEGNFLWNVKCNDTLNNNGWAVNRTVSIDTIYPDALINSISVSPGYLTIILNSSTNDTNLDYCRYTVFNSLGLVDGTLNNTFTCNSLISLTVSSYANYNLTFYSFDKANNLNKTTNNFTINPPVPAPIQGSGGGSTPSTLLPLATKTFCGDGAQQNPNSYGLIEDYWSCPQDAPGVGGNIDDFFESLFVFCLDNNPNTICGVSSLFSILYSTQGIEGNLTNSDIILPFNLDTAGLNCLSAEKASECYWNTQKGGVTFLISFIIIFIILTVKVIPTKGSKTRESFPRYIIYQTKKKHRKR
ncbi:MAG: hypothetical protein WC758_07875 [Candidatus Woesearchaeota archaeon]|jgi:hypothetical protein